MVWRENGKYGSCTGRTLRRGELRSKPLLKDRGFLVKTVIKEDINFTDTEIRNVLVKFPLQDGLNDDEVVKESRENRFEQFGHRRGHFAVNMLYSLGKRKRWLIPEILKDETNQSGAEMDYNVVLVERVSSTNDRWQCSQRLKHGDCYSVCAGNEIRKPRRRKFAHVGDLRRSSSNKTEIVYEVNHTERAPSWPTYLQYDWREWRDHRKARDKEKGKKNKRRSWGCYSRREIQRTAGQNLHKGSLFFGMREKDKVKQNYSNLILCDEDSSSSISFNLGKYISDVLVSSSGNKVKKPRVNEQVFSGLNPASSELVKFYGKGSAIYMDPVDCDCQDSSKSFDHSAPTLDVPVMSYWADKEEIVSVDVAVKRERLDPRTLHDHFGEKHKESLGLPRRFSISAEDLATQFVFTCSSLNLTGGCSEEVVEANVMVVSDALPSEKWLAMKEFLNSTFKRFSLDYKHDVQSPVNTTRTDCGEGAICQVPPRKGIMPFNLLYKINQWDSLAVSRNTALAELMPIIDSCYNQHMSDKENSSTGQRTPETILCGICCNEIRQGNFKGSKAVDGCCTAMRSCLHWFCDDCWRSYLSAQFQQGNTSIKCPEHGCDTLVDDVTVMGLLPCKFLKYSEMKRERGLELSSTWQWCPGDKCNLVVMVTTGGSQSEKKTGAEMEAVPVTCPCGHSWCFACQERPHWPASCKEAAFFQGQTKMYETLVRAKVGDITSVRVKRCPICNYPIEKNQGCPHMSCTMCKGEFCWTCLAHWAGHDWDACIHKTKEEEEVELVNVIGSSRFNTHMRVAIANYQARKGSVIFERYSSLGKLTKALLSQDQIVKVNDNRKPCTPHSLFSKYNSSNIPSYLKAALDFKFQAHLVLEGSSMLMAVSKSRYCHDKLTAQLSLLMFLIDRLENRAASKQLWSAAEKAHFQILLEAGRHCFHCIKHICIKIHQKQASTLY